MRARLLIAFLCFAGTAGAAPSKDECVTAHGNAQAERVASHLRAARTALLVCASSACPGIVTAECVPWLGEVERAMPTVVFEARDRDGSDVVEMTVLVDGEKVAERLDGRAVPLDPGEHLVRFVRHGAATERRVVLGEGEKARLVRLDFQAAALPPPPLSVQTSAPSWPVWVLGAVSVASLGAFGGFALDGLSKEHALDDCSPRCSPARTDPVHRDYVVSDVFLGVGIAAAAAAVLLVLLRPHHAPALDRSMLK